MINILVNGDISPASSVAVDALVSVLSVKTGHSILLGTELSAEADVNFVIGDVSCSKSFLDYLNANGLVVPESSESLLIKKLDAGRTVVIAGRDSRGLMYGIYEVADAVKFSTDGIDPLRNIEDAVESPHVVVRAVSTQLCNEDIERGWYENNEYWEWFFDMLARYRFNCYTLIYGHNTNYMIPPYAWFVRVPEYPDVRVRGMSEARRVANLKHLNDICEIAARYDIKLSIGVWTQLPVVNAREGLDFGDSLVENLPDGVKGCDYCARGMRLLLEKCPGINGVQLRMNEESGIPHEEQESYYRELFGGIVGCGRDVKLDLRYKSLSQETIDLAVAAGLDVTVSTKYWCEHMGLPYHPAQQEPLYSPSRYGYGTMLKHSRNYRVTYRLWTFGTSRLLLWGDGDYAGRFARSCTLGGGEGFEIMAPLSNMGFGNDPGKWSIFADESLVSYRWEYERYWPYFLNFGRFGYNPDASENIWDRELESRFGDSWQKISKAYASASGVLPLITATTLFSANSWRFWPEMLPCLHLDSYRKIQPSDYSQFYAISRFEMTPFWRGEGWTADCCGFVEDAVNGSLNGKWTPLEVSAKLRELGDEILAALDGCDGDGAELRATVMDMNVLAQLAYYHAAKKLAATELEFFYCDRDVLRLPVIWKHINQAREHWLKIVELTDGKYYDRMIMGFSLEHNSDFASKLQQHIGHWKDRVADVDADVAFVAELMRVNNISADSDVSHLKRYPGEDIALLGDKPVITQLDASEFMPGEDFEVTFRVEYPRELRCVNLYHRAMEQTRAWSKVAMESLGDGIHRGTVPACDIDMNYDLLYYAEACGEVSGVLWPSWRERAPYVVVPTVVKK